MRPSNSAIELMREEQRERRARWEVARENGEYYFATVVNAEDVERAQQLAARVLAERPVINDNGWLKNVLAGAKHILHPNRTLDAACDELSQLASYEIQGNVELAEIEMESGLLEPYEGGEVLSIVAWNIVNDNFLVREQPQ